MKMLFIQIYFCLLLFPYLIGNAAKLPFPENLSTITMQVDAINHEFRCSGKIVGKPTKNVIDLQLEKLRRLGKDFKESAAFQSMKNFDVEHNLRKMAIAEEAKKARVEVKGKQAHQREMAREDQVMDYSGGYVFQVSDLTRIRRFLILGCAGGTYYASEKELTTENLNEMIEIINKGDAADILTELYDISTNNRNPKQDPVMLVLALCARYRVHDVSQKKTMLSRTNLKRKPESQEMIDPDTDYQLPYEYSSYIQQMHATAFTMLQDVCRIPTHLFQFIEFCKAVCDATSIVTKVSSKGWGRRMRAAVSSWYTYKELNHLAMLITKYKKRNGYSHRDIFRLAHPNAKEHVSGKEHVLEVHQLYNYAVKGALMTRHNQLDEKSYPEETINNEANSKALDFVEAYISLNAETPEAEVVAKIKQFKLVREHIPTEHLNSPAVWIALLEDMPFTAMVRNLGKMASIGILTGEKLADTINKLTDEETIKKSRIHPIQLLMAKCVYGAGHGMKGDNNWEVNKELENALEKAFLTSFKNVEPTGKRYLLALDVSGSMTYCNIQNTFLTAMQASAAMALINIKIEKSVDVCLFSSGFTQVQVDKNTSLDEMLKSVDNLPFECTNCALPMIWAKDNKKEYDAFIVYTDNDTNEGEVHAFQALRNYRESSGINDAKLIVVGMTASAFTIADPKDAGMMDVAGFDSAVPQIIADFVTGKI